MKTNSKLLAAGLAILVTGAAIGWAASHLSHSQRAVTPDSLAAAGPEKPTANLTPQVRFESTPAHPTMHRASPPAGRYLAAGTQLTVASSTRLSSETARPGDGWSGTVLRPVYRNGHEVIPSGSTVRGVVSVAERAERGRRARLRLTMRSVMVNGHRHEVHGSSEMVVAHSPRARNIGAVAGGTAAGALVGSAVGHGSKGTLIGALLGGGAATAVVASSKGYQATIDAGRPLRFTTR